MRDDMTGEGPCLFILLDLRFVILIAVMRNKQKGKDKLTTKNNKLNNTQPN